jgi:hypothetical protein
MIIMNSSLHYWFRPAAILCVLVLLAGCTKRVAVGMDQLENGEHTNKTYVLKVKDGREIVSDRVTFDDSSLVLHNVIVEGKRTGIEPDSIPLVEVESLATIETNWMVTAVVLAPIVFVGVLFFWMLLDSPGGGMEGTSD